MKNVFSYCLATSLIWLAGSGCRQLTDGPPRPTPPTVTGHIYVDRSVKDAELLSPPEAKAILLARSMGIDSSGGGMGFGDIGVVFEVFTTPDDWVVFCRRGKFDPGRTVHVDKAWKVGPVSEGPPPGLTVHIDPPITPGG